MSDKIKEPNKKETISCDELDRVSGGAGVVFEYYRAECGYCSWQSEVLKKPGKLTECGVCNNGSQYIRYYAYVDEEWVRIKPLDITRTTI